ncbi:MAG: hypothetical protein AMJ90_07055 [candidate division Zixibacteria bacterium SM23_73_2]|nr:MAG: hypothetical protein AMJ90_07055 [candidate division Zixibacteria bacterium SM23_73_2]
MEKNISSIFFSFLLILIIFSCQNPVSNDKGIDICFALPEAGSVKFEIKNATGYTVWTHEAWYGAGEHSMAWHCVNNDGEKVKKGIYICDIKIGNRKESKFLYVD